jgi:hypothetical protein
MLSLYGQFVAEVSPRHVPIQLLARAAAATDPEAAGIWDQLRPAAQAASPCPTPSRQRVVAG